MHTLAKSFNEEAKCANDRACFMKEVKSGSQLGYTKEAFKTLKERPKVGKKLVRIGTALVLSPDPFCDLPGGLIVVTGLAMAKFREPSAISDVKPAIKRMLGDLQSGAL
jgi:hypothetical protein